MTRFVTLQSSRCLPRAGTTACQAISQTQVSAVHPPLSFQFPPDPASCYQSSAALVSAFGNFNAHANHFEFTRTRRSSSSLNRLRGVSLGRLLQCLQSLISKLFSNTVLLLLLTPPVFVWHWCETPLKVMHDVSSCW